MGTLYVIEPGARVEKHYEQFIVTKHDEILTAVPAAHVSQVVLTGYAGVTTQALHVMLRRGIGLVMLGYYGQLLGHLRPPGGGNLALRQTQYQCGLDTAFCLEFSRAVVAGKLANCRTIARRIARSHDIPPHCLEDILQALEAVEQANDLAALRGLEGFAARAYFAVLRSKLPSGFGFSRRTRRPPTDPVNALLSLGYTLLTTNLVAALEIVGLDPYDGFFHADRYGRPALALDLVEEFRAPVVDSVVLTMVNKRIVTVDDFERDAKGGMRLTPKALRQFFKQYTHRLQTTIVHPLAGRPLSYQKIFEIQARCLSKAILGQADMYKPFRIR